TPAPAAAPAAGRGRGRAGARSRPRRPRAPARDRGGSSPAARAGRAGSGTGRGNGSGRARRGGDGGALSPPLLVACEKAFGALERAAERLDPLLEQLAALGGERVAALRGPGRALVPLRADEPLLLECPQQAIEVAHLDALLA